MLYALMLHTHASCSCFMLTLIQSEVKSTVRRGRGREGRRGIGEGGREGRERGRKGGKGEEKERCKERGRHNISGQLHVTEGKR